MFDPIKYWEDREWTGDFDPRIESIFKPYLKGRSVLDFGCGHGKWYPSLKHMDYLGVDISDKFLKVFQKTYPQAKTLKKDIRELDLPRTFDMGFCYTVLEHVPKEDIEQTIRVMEKHSKRWIIAEPEIPAFKENKIAKHCFRHEYDKLLPVVSKRKIDDIMRLYVARF